jgi:hypothetical protein
MQQSNQPIDTPDFRIVGALDDVSPVDGILFALSLPKGQGVIMELSAEHPYHDGPLKGFQKIRTSLGITCPFCKVPVLRYEYPEIELCVAICKEIAIFNRSPGERIRLGKWRRMIRETTSTWTAIEANRKGGPHSGNN